MVEPSPFTYVSGYANRFQELLRYVRNEKERASQSKTKDDTANNDNEDDGEDTTPRRVDVASAVVEIVTTEVVVPERPREAFGFPIRYTRGFRLPFYNLMSISWDWTLQTVRTVARLKPNLIHASSP